MDTTNETEQGQQEMTEAEKKALVDDLFDFRPRRSQRDREMTLLAAQLDASESESRPPADW